MPLGAPERDGSTIGPARAGAAGVLGGAAAVGLVWVIAGRAPVPPAAPPFAAAPTPAELTATPGPGTTPAPANPEPPVGPSDDQDPPPAGEPDPEPDTPANTLALKVRLNHATREELDLLPGIGPVLAERIINDRARLGPYTSLLDFQRVPGIGEKTAARLAPHVRFD